MEFRRRFLHLFFHDILGTQYYIARVTIKIKSNELTVQLTLHHDRKAPQAAYLASHT